MSNISVDTNILIYLYDSSNNHKRTVAEEIIVDTPRISSQVVSEFLNASRRLLNIPKYEVLQRCYKVISNCVIISLTQESLNSSLKLMKKYDFQLFDSIIVSSSLNAGCRILYSEDMQHNLLVEKRLRIINPFLL